ncbi:MAG: hypothetical protein FD189_455 [Elusimicrobia bacterium]|nr:MAG: hypothetical protein FD154_510 [Elusimicrobiota bacterium]KAF0157680.1 MAG: hypothetical protein FD189_455 [Elusimicrobiota bacterium]
MTGAGKPAIEELLEAGRRSLARGDADAAIHHFNRALKSSPVSPEARAGLYGAFMLKGDAGQKQFYVLAMEAARLSGGAGAAESAALDRLLTAGFKAGRLDELAREFRARAGKDPSAALFLKRIYAMSLLAAENAPRASDYRPNLFIRVFFDCLLLPASCAAIVASVAIPRARPAFGFGVFLFACYAVYRAALMLLRRYR